MILSLSCKIESIIGFLLLYGTLASLNSKTISTKVKSLFIAFLVFFICPGYQFIFITSPLNIKNWTLTVLNYNYLFFLLLLMLYLVSLFNSKVLIFLLFLF